MSMNHHHRAAMGMLVGLALTTPPGPAQTVYTPYTFATLAGNSGYGSVDGTGSAARFNLPFGVAADAAGNLYVADSGNSVIRKSTPAGVVTTLVGLTGSPGSADGAGSAARFNSPGGVAVDGAGVLYVMDTYNYLIRKVTPDGTVTTLAGKAGFSGSADGTGGAARFGRSQGLAVDAAGNLYVADMENSTIRKVTPAGGVSTLAGMAGQTGSADGAGSAARFYLPFGVAVDGAGNLYVGDSANGTVRVVTPAGLVRTLAGKAGSFGNVDATGAAARFGTPWGVAVDSVGLVYVTDLHNNEVREITPEGAVATLAGLALRDKQGNPVGGSADGTGSAARFNQPYAVTADRAGGLYVADALNNTLRQMVRTGGNWVVTTFAGLAGSAGSADGTGALARFSGPAGVAVDVGGNLFVADRNNHTIRQVTPAGTVTTLGGKAGVAGGTDGMGSVARFNHPWGVAVDGSDNLYVADAGNSSIRKLAPIGTNWVVTTIAGLAGSTGYADGTGTAARFTTPAGVAVDGAGNLYVVDQAYDTLRKVAPAGAAGWLVTTVAGQPGSPGTGDGAGGSARFTTPTGLAVDRAGILYVADSGNNAIRKVTPFGTNWVVTTLAAVPAGLGGFNDGLGSAARFAAPFGVAVGGAGIVYVADTSNNTIRRITPEGVVTTIAGTPGLGQGGNGDGTGGVARFSAPFGVAVDGAGAVYVTDTDNNTIRKGFPVTPSIIASGAGFGFNNGQFGFLLAGPAGEDVVVEASTDLVTWLPLWTNTFSGPLFFSDPATGVSSNRFYRLLLP